MATHTKDTTTNTTAPEAPVVGEREYAKAVEYLRQHSRLDIDDFLSRVQPLDLLQAPVGPTEQCLSIDQIADIADSDVSVAARYPQQRVHLAHCQDCRGAAELYDALQEEDFSSYETELDLELYSQRRVTLSAEHDEPLEIIVLNKSAAGIESINPATVRLRGPVDAEGCTIKTLPPTDDYGAPEAAVLAFGRYASRLPENFSALCDQVILEGKTYSGASFRKAALLCFEQT